MQIRCKRLGGKITKRSRFGPKLKDQKKLTLTTSITCEKTKLHYHVLDSERVEHYVRRDEIPRLISNTKKLRTLLTLSARHRYSTKYLDEIALQLRRTKRLGLNLVAGNPQYLSMDEAKSRPADVLTHLTVATRKLLPDCEIFIGTEGLLKLSTSLAKEYDLKPFFLLDRSLNHDLLKVLNEIPKGETAVYTPYLVSEQGEKIAQEILTLLGPYIVRRRWVQRRMIENGYEPSYESVKKIIKLSEKSRKRVEDDPLGKLLLNCASKLAVFGPTEKVAEDIRNLFDQGITIVMGLPIKECEEQVIAFGRCVTMASQQ